MIDIKKEKNNSYRFVVTSGEGNALLQSIQFPTKKELDTTVKKLSPLMKKPSVFERKTDHNGKFHFTLKDTSGSIIGSSNTYTSEAGMENGITNVRKRISFLSRSKSL
ncbi:YegP family protein [uncultured Muriicola sp.]|uniref:YegP family protein n=1 Tax=uncultured Muriicola sp. TaxID=1583102 RepID=UPI002632892D|nr:YegP family protein [uncultured Muriicola sp.]